MTVANSSRHRTRGGTLLAVVAAAIRSSASPSRHGKVTGPNEGDWQSLQKPWPAQLISRQILRTHSIVASTARFSLMRKRCPAGRSAG